MGNLLDRKSFIKSVTAAGLGVSMMGRNALASGLTAQNEIPVGIIGLDGSHSPAFTNLINNPEGNPEFAIPELSGFKVVAAYPYGSRTIESSYSRIPQYTEDMKKMGVEIVDSIETLLNKVEVVLLMTNDGNPRLKQALQVMKAGKTVFMDKPLAASLKDIVAIMDASRQYNVPIFSTSVWRYVKYTQEVRNEGLIGDVLGADTFSVAPIEESHPDLFWYGIHGVEMLFTVMGTGCERISRTTTSNDVVVGVWDDGRLGTFRGIREGRGGRGGTAFGTRGIQSLGPREEGFKPLVIAILEFFRTGISPVSMEETLEVYAFMEAADESKRRGKSAWVSLEEVIEQARS